YRRRRPPPRPRAGGHTVCADRTGAHKGAVPDGYARQQDRSTTNPHVLADPYRQCALQTAASLVKSVGMVRAVDMHGGSEHAAWADPDGRRVKNDAACIHVYPVAKREVAAVGDVERSEERRV